jgi:PKD domain
MRPALRAAAGLAFVCGLAALVPAASVSAATQAGIIVGYPGAQTFVGADQIAAQSDVTSVDYTLRSPGAQQMIPESGLSVRKLIGLAGADPDKVGFVTVPRPVGTTAYLPGSDFADPPPFPEGPALVWVESDTARFLRPVRNATDINAEDFIVTTTGASLTIGLHAGNILKVAAHVNTARPRARKPVSFSANAAGQLPSEQLSYRWQFGDGTVGQGPAVSHAFRYKGSYKVLVSVTGDRDSGGESAPLALTVGRVKKKGAGGAGPAKGPSSHGAAGKGSGSGGGDGSRQSGGAGSAAAASTGAATNTRTQAKAASQSARTQAVETVSGPLQRVAGTLLPDLSQPAKALSGSSFLRALSGAESGGSPSSPSVPSDDGDSGGRSKLSIAWPAAALALLFAAGIAWESRGRLWDRLA